MINKEKLSNFYNQLLDPKTKASLIKKLKQDPSATLATFGLDIQNDVEVRFFQNSLNKIYFVMPNSSDLEADLTLVSAAGKPASTFGSASSGGSVSTIASCFACVSTVGTAGSVATGN